MYKIKNSIVDILIYKLNNEGSTYNSMSTISGLTRSQLTLILKHNGKGITLDRLMVVIDKLGIDIRIIEF